VNAVTQRASDDDLTKNLTRQNAQEFLALAAGVPLRTHAHTYALAEANRALDDLRGGRLSGAAVLVP